MGKGSSAWAKQSNASWVLSLRSIPFGEGSEGQQAVLTLVQPRAPKAIGRAMIWEALSSALPAGVWKCTATAPQVPFLKLCLQ